jgi:hypothetical protein
MAKGEMMKQALRQPMSNGSILRMILYSWLILAKDSRVWAQQSTQPSRPATPDRLLITTTGVISSGTDSAGMFGGQRSLAGLR